MMLGLTVMFKINTEHTTTKFGMFQENKNNNIVIPIIWLTTKVRIVIFFGSLRVSNKTKGKCVEYSKDWSE